jgi:hypothetical protein
MQSENWSASFRLTLPLHSGQRLSGAHRFGFGVDSFEEPGQSSPSPCIRQNIRPWHLSGRPVVHVSQHTLKRLARTIMVIGRQCAGKKMPSSLIGSLRQHDAPKLDAVTSQSQTECFPQSASQCHDFSSAVTGCYVCASLIGPHCTLLHVASGL